MEQRVRDRNSQYQLWKCGRGHCSYSECFSSRRASEYKYLSIYVLFSSLLIIWCETINIQPYIPGFKVLNPVKTSLRERACVESLCIPLQGKGSYALDCRLYSCTVVCGCRASLLSLIGDWAWPSKMSTG